MLSRIVEWEVNREGTTDTHSSGMDCRLEGTFLMIKSEKNIILAALTVMQDY